MRKFVYSIALILMGASLVLSGCSPKATPNATETAPAATEAVVVAPTVEPTHEPVTLKYWDYSQERLDFYKQAAVEFNKEYPWITVVPETMVEDDYKQALPLAFQGNSSPDIYVYTWPAAGDYFETKDLIDLGWAAPLDETVLPADFRSRFRGTNNMMDGIYSKDGKVYTIPRPPSNGVAGYAYMYYNKDVIAAAGLTDKIPTTWKEFEAACATLKAAGKYCFAAATKSAIELNRLIIPFMGTGVKGYNDSGISAITGKYSIMTDPDYVTAMEFLRSLYKAGYAYHSLK